MEEAILEEIENLKKELEVEKRKTPKDTSKIASKLYSIGKQYKNFGRYDEALNYLNEYLKIKKKTLRRH